MTYKTHIAGGVLFFSLAVDSNLLHHIQSMPFAGILSGVCLGGAIIGSVLPDIDKQGTFISNRAKFIAFLLTSVPHRTFLHLPIFIAIFSYLLLLISSFPGWIAFVTGLFLGICSHAVLDLFNKKGIALLYPLSKKTFSVASIPQRSWQEFLFFMGIVFSIIMIWRK